MYRISLNLLPLVLFFSVIYSQEAKIKVSDDILYKKFIHSLNIEGIDTLLSGQNKRSNPTVSLLIYKRTKTEILNSMSEKLLS